MKDECLPSPPAGGFGGRWFGDDMSAFAKASADAEFCS